MYLAWYFTKAKRYSPITQTEAKQLWTIHKHNARCNSKKWHQVRKGKVTVGFECECGYKHLQKKPLVAHAPAAINSQISAFDQLHTTHRSV